MKSLAVNKKLFKILCLSLALALTLPMFSGCSETKEVDIAKLSADIKVQKAPEGTPENMLLSLPPQSPYDRPDSRTYTFRGVEYELRIGGPGSDYTNYSPDLVYEIVTDAPARGAIYYTGEPYSTAHLELNPL